MAATTNRVLGLAAGLSVIVCKVWTGYIAALGSRQLTKCHYVVGTLAAI
jgi:hypothetical protein